MKIVLTVFLVILFLLALFNALRLRGNYLFSKGQVMEALAFEPYNYLYHFAAGTALLQSKQSGLAVEHLKRAIKLNPSYTDAISNLAVALIIEGRYDEAREALTDLKRIDPGDAYRAGNLEVLEKLLREKGAKDGD